MLDLNMLNLMCITEMCQFEYSSLLEMQYDDVTKEKYGRCQARLLSKCQDSKQRVEDTSWNCSSVTQRPVHELIDHTMYEF